MEAMAARGRIVLIVFVGLIVVLGLGFGWGASGQRGLQSALDDARQQLDLAEARGQILDARVSLYNNNFGDASRHFEDAKTPLRRVKQRYQDESLRDAAARIDAALGLLEEGQRLAGRLDQAANAKAGEALEAMKVGK
jgi:hypothetical protein